MRALSTNLAPASPWALKVPSTSGMPLPMRVLAMINLGLPFFCDFADWKALKNSMMLLPSMVWTSKP